jgi:hypothetical protein
MNFDVGNALDDIRDMIPNFDFSNFASNEPIMFWRVPFFVKIVQDIKVDFDMTTKQKIVSWCLKATHAQDCLLVILIDGLGQHMSEMNSIILS